MFQSLGIGAIVSMIRKSNAREDGSATTCDESATVITQAGSSDYNPKDDEVIDGEEVDDKLVKKKGKVSRKKKCANINRRKVSETSSPMAPGRVLALSPEGSKRLLTPDEPVVARLTRQKVREDVDKSLLHKGQGPLRNDDELASMEEGSRMCMDLSPVAPSVANFEMDTESSVIEYACTDILKNSLRNRHHHVKKEYFDNVEASKVSIKSPVSDITDTEWQRLVELWSTTRHKETCANNKVNRTKVKFAQKTGSRCYVAHVHATLRSTLKGEVLSAFDIFKATHNSTKHGFSEDVQVAISEMEEKMTAPVQEGEERKSSVSVVAEVLTKHRPSSKFLKNVGLQPNSTDKSSKSNAVVNARVLDLQEQLEMSRQRSEVMREEMDAMKRKAAKAEAAQVERDKSCEVLLKKAEEKDAKYAQLMALLGAKTGN
ncbi:hypothetical protein D1007_44029 [Hordeum vulgare]|nr:hypothetical protein D1007_44029 [Hordeum vulgare]